MNPLIPLWVGLYVGRGCDSWILNPPKYQKLQSGSPVHSVCSPYESFSLISVSLKHCGLASQVLRGEFHSGNNSSTFRSLVPQEWLHVQLREIQVRGFGCIFSAKKPGCETDAGPHCASVDSVWCAFARVLLHLFSRTGYLENLKGAWKYGMRKMLLAKKETVIAMYPTSISTFFYFLCVTAWWVPCTLRTRAVHLLPKSISNISGLILISLLLNN